jgi:hypothetical protein
VRVASTTYALDIMETPKVNGRCAGFAAYDAWADALLKESEFPKGAPLPMLMERLMCQADGVTMIGERRQAYRFLQEQTGLSSQARLELEKAAQLFHEESSLALQMGKVIGNMQMGEKQALSLARREVREELAQLIQEAKGLNMQAAAHMRQALQLQNWVVP